MIKPRVESTRRTPVLLIVEEEPAVLHLLELALGQKGFDVIAATNGYEAVEIYEEQADDIDLVLVDVRMNELGGPETFAKLREINPDVRCCFMSGGDTAVNKTDALLDSGALQVFRKPFISLNEFTAALHKLVNP
jgi:DNA-binding response OmpR family regulator